MTSLARRAVTGLGLPSGGAPRRPGPHRDRRAQRRDRDHQLSRGHAVHGDGPPGAVVGGVVAPELVTAGAANETLGLRLARLLGVEDDDTVEGAIARLCDVPEAVGQAAAALLNHKNKTARDGAARIRAWLAQDPLDRDPAEWRSCLFNDKGELRKALEGVPEIEAEALRLEAAEAHLASCRLLEATEALLLLRLTSKLSSVSAPASVLAAMAKLSSWAPTSRSLPPVLVAVRVMAPLAPLLRLLRVTPVAAVSEPATRAAKSVTSVAPAEPVPLAESSVKVTLRPAPRPTPSRATA
jgi:hypothetical protein